jgi:anti-sigma regulatory factor (Ser/Thr protein kinase)
MDVFSHMAEQVQLDDLTLVALRRNIRSEVPCHRMTRGAELKNLPLFRHFVEESCQRFHVEAEVTESLKLATDEICSNIIQYGYMDQAAGDITLSVEKHPGEIRIEIQDRGRYFHPESAAEPELGNDLFTRKTGGLGIHLVRELVDDVAYSRKDGTNTLGLKKKYPQPAKKV